jgi:molybdopterin-guanine dinucleotide biosynthesis protein A
MKSRSGSVNPSICIGFFVGGRGSRMGGVAKGNLELTPGVRLLDRLVAECRQALPDTPLVLVGAADAYAALGLPVLGDAPAGVGPLGGLRALLAFAAQHEHAAALALACDLPFLDAALITRLATEAPEAAFLAPRAGELWHTLSARYSVTALAAVDAALAAGERALQRVALRLGSGARELTLTANEAGLLRDWDTPADREGA